MNEIIVSCYQTLILKILYYASEWSSIIVTKLLFPIVSLQIESSSQVPQICYHTIIKYTYDWNILFSIFSFYKICYNIFPI